jgi:hypothetical protein
MRIRGRRSLYQSCVIGVSLIASQLQTMPSKPIIFGLELVRVFERKQDEGNKRREYTKGEKCLKRPDRNYII